MSGRSKLGEAQFFLQQLSSLQANSIDSSMKFRYFASACSSALYGSLQHLLYDYAKKFWPGIDQLDYLDTRLFQLLAKATNRSDARDFIEWYNGLIDRIRKDRDSSIVWDVRKIETRRGVLPYSYQQAFFEAVNFSSGTVTGRIALSVVQPNSVSVYFKDYPDRSVQDAIGNTVTFVESLLDEAESGFGKP
jgi:hypothetical protein